MKHTDDVTGSGGRGSRRATETARSRKRPAHGVLIYNHQATIVFLTVCTKDRVPWLADDEIHSLLRSVWKEATAWLVGKYVIMPDHIHIFAAPGPIHVSFDNWVRYWKSRFMKQHGKPAHRWQPNHWDTRLRASGSYAEKWEYVRNNPVRHGLVDCAEVWSFQGEIHVLRW